MLRVLYVGMVGCVAICLYGVMGWPSSGVGAVDGEIVLFYIRVCRSWAVAFE